MTEPIAIRGLAHVGIRVHELDRSLRFYELLGFEKTLGPMGPEPVVVLEHPSGLELNLILNARSATPHNVLMDVPEKHAGVTHIALACPDVVAAKAKLEAAGFPPSEGPIRLGPHSLAVFVRDPDRNVIELTERV
jgi:lactoylglutathione lyase